MKRKDVEMFNLSFLDILASALAAVLFLFIVVPKGGGEAPAVSPQLSVKFDTTQMTFFGELPDSMLRHEIGDSLLTLIIDYDEMPSIKDCPKAVPCPKCPDTKKLHRTIASMQKALAERDIYIDKLEKQTKVKSKRPERFVKPKETPKETPKAKEVQKTLVSQKVKTETDRTVPKYKGDMPSVPCKFSVEVKWENKTDNIDLFLCKDGSCVFGGKKRNANIGFWDSGKSKTSIFGGDLRSTQEAIRQFDEVLEGKYEIYIQYKAAKDSPQPSVPVSGLIYTKTNENGEIGKTFSADIPFDKNQRTMIGTVNVTPDGKFTFDRKAR